MKYCGNTTNLHFNLSSKHLAEYNNSAASKLSNSTSDNNERDLVGDEKHRGVCKLFCRENTTYHSENNPSHTYTSKVFLANL